MKIKCNNRTVAECTCGPLDSTFFVNPSQCSDALTKKVEHKWAIAPQYMERFRTVLYIFQASGPTIQHDCSSMKWSDAAER